MAAEAQTRMAMQAQQKLAKHALSGLFEKMRSGSFAVVYNDGTTERFGIGEPLFTIRLNDDDLLNLLYGDLLMNFGEAYMDGRIDVEGDLADVMSLALKSGLMSATQTGFTGAAIKAARKLRSPKQDANNIARHYDLGNDFFRLWLDGSMTYSCAYFRKSTDALCQAQLQKIEHSLRKLRLQAGETLLDIGCGWGSAVMYGAEHFDAQATGITLSEEQYAGADAMIKSKGLQNKAKVRLMDYGVLAASGEKFDKIVSIGMIEHVGREHLAEFVQNVKTMLKPGGLALLHMITNVEAGPVNRWIEEYIFPGGYLPTLSEMSQHLYANDFRIWDVENLAPHYLLTLDHWSERYERVVPLVERKFDERFVRMWRLYLRVSSAAFRNGVVEVHQILASNGPPLGLPMTREDIYFEVDDGKRTTPSAEAAATPRSGTEDGPVLR